MKAFPYALGGMAALLLWALCTHNDVYKAYLVILLFLGLNLLILVGICTKHR